jgi:hypothetical protein
MQDPTSWLVRWVPDLDWKGVVAILALVQPWLKAGWDKFFRQAKITMYQSGFVETGFSLFGPTVALSGVLRAQHRDIFVREMRVEVTRIRDNATRKLEWLFFRPLAGPARADNMEPCAAFLLGTSSPKRYTIVFYDTETTDFIRKGYDALRQQWNSVLTASGHYEALRQPDLTNDGRLALQATRASLFREFVKREEAFRLHEQVRQRCYWEAGSFRLKLIVEATDPSRRTEKEWTISLTASAVDSLIRNSFDIASVGLGESEEGAWSFSYIPYEEVAK